jgi:N-acetylmuramoyl-L-alanine amidase
MVPFSDLVQTGAAQNERPVLIIDPGHGGADGGAVAPDGTLESDINLDIALRLEALAAFWGVETVMTRSTAEIDYPAEAESLAAMKRADQNARIALINETPGAVLFSIHQNNYPASSPWGIQVFYGAVTDSSVLAETLQENLTGQLCPDNRRVAEPIDEGIYLMRKAQCQSVLVECGFLSNPNDLEKLESDGYRTQLAAVMLASYLQYTRGTAL